MTSEFTAFKLAFIMSASHETFDPYLEWLGIEPHERPVDHYRLLEVARLEADAEKIAAAADKRMAHVRTFQTGPRGAFTQQLLNELSTAKLCLLNPKSKADYDAALQTPAGPASDYGPLPPPVAPPVMSGTTVVAEPPAASPSREPAVNIVVKHDARRRPRAWQAKLLVPGIVVVIGIAVAAIAVWTVGQASTGDDRVEKAVGETETKKNPAPSPTGEVPDRDEPSDRVTITQEGSGAVNFPASVAKLTGPSIALETHDGETLATKWRSLEDELSWRFNIIRPGSFLAVVTYQADEDAAGSRYELLLDDKQFQVRDVVPTEPQDDESKDAFYVIIRRSGTHTLTVRPIEITGSELMAFKSIRFEQQ